MSDNPHQPPWQVDPATNPYKQPLYRDVRLLAATVCISSTTVLGVVREANRAIASSPTIYWSLVVIQVLLGAVGVGLAVYALRRRASHWS